MSVDIHHIFSLKSGSMVAEEDLRANLNLSWLKRLKESIIHLETLFIPAVLRRWRVLCQTHPRQLCRRIAHSQGNIQGFSLWRRTADISNSAGSGPTFSLSFSLSEMLHSHSLSPLPLFSSYLTSETPKQSILTRAIRSAEWSEGCHLFSPCLSFHSFSPSYLLRFYIFPSLLV